MMSLNNERFKYICLWVWVLAIWIGSLWPSPPTTVEGGDKIQHFIGYAVLAILAYRIWPRFFLVCSAAALMGIAVEVAQGWSGWRTFDPADMLANTIGALLGGLICRILCKKTI
jgi:VanZ family protein